MNKQPSHSPLPWSTVATSPSFDALVAANSSDIFHYTIDDDGLYFNPADTALIVRAVNSYYEREELIKELVDVCERALDYMTGDQAARAGIYDAIAKAAKTTGGEG